jgi:hypothetical protein
VPEVMRQRIQRMMKMREIVARYDERETAKTV